MNRVVCEPPLHKSTQSWQQKGEESPYRKAGEGEAINPDADLPDAVAGPCKRWIARTRQASGMPLAITGQHQQNCCDPEDDGLVLR